MTESPEERAYLSRVYLLATGDVERRVMSALSAEIEEGARELVLRNGALSLHVARMFLVETVALNMLLNLAVTGKELDIEMKARYLGRRALYAIQTGGYERGGVKPNAEETSARDNPADLPEVQVDLVAEEPELSEAVPELRLAVLGQPEADQEDAGGVGEGA